MKTQNGRQRGSQTLTDREKEIVMMAAQGAVDKDISRAMGIQPSTLNGYWTHIRLKLGVATRTEAVAACVQADASTTHDENETLRARVAELEETCRDLTRRESHLRDLLNVVPEGLVVLEMSGKVRYCNPRFAEILCLAESEIVGRTIQSLLDPEAAAIIQRKIKLRNKGVKSHYDQQVVVRSGRRLWLRFSSCPAYEAGKARAIVSVIADMTSRKRLETELRDALELGENRDEGLRALLDLAPIGVIVFNAKGEPTRANARIAEQFGLPPGTVPSREEWLALRCRREPEGRLVRENRRLVTRLLNGTDRIVDERVFIDLPDGTRREVITSGVAIRNRSGTVVGAIQTTLKSDD